MLSLTFKSKLALPTFLLIFPVRFPIIVLSSELLEGGLSAPDSREQDEEKTGPVFWGRAFPSPGSVVFGVMELCTFPLDSAIPSEDIAVPVIPVVPFMML